MRYLVAISFALLVFAGAAAWVVETEPDWYLRSRYPLEYEHVISAYAGERHLDPSLVAAVIYAEAASTRTCGRVPAPWGSCRCSPRPASSSRGRQVEPTSSRPTCATPTSTCATGPGFSSTCAPATTATSRRRSPPTTPGPPMSTSGAVPERGSSSRRHAPTSTRCCASSR